MVENKGTSLGKKVGFGCLGLIVLIIIISVASSGKNSTQKVDSPSATTTTTTSSTKSEDKVYGVGDSVKLNKAIVTVNKVETSTGGTYSNPAEGNKWVNVNVTVENTDSTNQFVTTLGQMFIKDSDNNSFQVAVTDKALSDPNNSLDGSIIAKSKRTGWVGFEVKNDSKGLQFQYNGSLWGGGAISVDLGQ